MNIYLKRKFFSSCVCVLRCLLVGLTMCGTQWLSAGMAMAVNWNELNLSPQQSSQIHALEMNWERTHQRITREIEQDQASIKRLLPSGNRTKIQDLQRRIMKNKMYLMNQSTETFMKKREQLNPDQQSRLKRMFH